MSSAVNGQLAIAQSPQPPLNKPKKAKQTKWDWSNHIDSTNGDNRTLAPLIRSINKPQTNPVEIEKNYLSSTTLIPPSSFVEPAQLESIDTTTGLVAVSKEAFEPLSTQTSITAEPLNPQPFTESFPISSSTVVIPSTRPPMESISITTQNKPETITSPSVLISSSTISTSKYSKTIPLIKQSKPSSRRPSKANKSLQKNVANLENAFKILDMSNFDLKSTKKTHSASESQTTMQADNQSKSSSKFSLPIHKLLKEGLPNQYWSSIPKLFKSSSEDQTASSSDVNQIRSKVSKEIDEEGENDLEKNSMLSIPVLVPVDLSQDDYRKSISSSVLKPIVIPLKEKGKLIPAYVLHVGKHSHRIHKRNVLKEKKLLNFPIKTSLLSHLIPTLIKNIQIKAIIKSKSNLKNNLAASAQSLIPFYALPPETILKQLANTLKLDINSKDLNKLMPAYYFPAHYYFQYLPIALKNSEQLKALPVRARTPKAESMKSNKGQSNGMMAVSSSDSKLVVKPPTSYPVVLDYYNVNRYLNQLSNIGTSAFNTNFYPPLIYANLANSLPLSDVNRLKSNNKIKSWHKKSKGKSVMNPNELKANDKSTNITMPANIYVPDEVLDDFDVIKPNDEDNSKSNSTATSSTIPKELKDNIVPEESKVVRVFAKIKPNTNRYNERVELQTPADTAVRKIMVQNGRVETLPMNDMNSLKEIDARHTPKTTMANGVSRGRLRVTNGGNQKTFSMADDVRQDTVQNHYRYNTTNYVDQLNAGHKNRYSQS